MAFETTASAVGLFERSEDREIRTLTVRDLNPPSLPLDYIPVVADEGFEPSLSGT